MKKITALILVVLMLISTVSAEAATVAAIDTGANSGKCGVDATWILNTETGEVFISGSGRINDYRSKSSPFYNRRSVIKSVVIDEGIEYIGNLAFMDCFNLESVSISSTVTEMGESAFAKCTALKTVVMGNGMEIIGKYAFENCASLENIEFSNNLREIGVSAFKNCSSINKLVFPNSLQKIKNSAFADCNAVSEIEFSEGLTYIEACVFSDCKSLTSITLPDSLVTLGQNAFLRCTALSKIKLGKNITSICKNPFIGTDFYYQGSNWKNGGLYLDNFLLEAKEDVKGEFTVADGTRFISDGCFVGTSYSKVILPDSIESIGEYCFENCGKLDTVELGNGLKKIPDRAFYYSCVKNIVIPDSVSEIGKSAFESCEYLTDLKLGNSIKTINEKAFYKCNRIAEIIIPDSVETIEAYAFDGILTEKVVFGKGLKTIKDNNFCSMSMKSLVIGENVETIGNNCFNDCKSLKTVVMGNSVKKVGNNVFKGCTEFDTLYYSGTEKEFNSIQIGNSPVLRGVAYVYYNCEHTEPATEPPVATEPPETATYDFYYMPDYDYRYGYKIIMHIYDDSKYASCTDYEMTMKNWVYHAQVTAPVTQKIIKIEYEYLTKDNDRAGSRIFTCSSGREYSWFANRMVKDKGYGNPDIVDYDPIEATEPSEGESLIAEFYFAPLPKYVEKGYTFKICLEVTSTEGLSYIYKDLTPVERKIFGRDMYGVKLDVTDYAGRSGKYISYIDYQVIDSNGNIEADYWYQETYDKYDKKIMYAVSDLHYSLYDIDVLNCEYPGDDTSVTGEFYFVPLQKYVDDGCNFTISVSTVSGDDSTTSFEEPMKLYGYTADGRSVYCAKFDITDYLGTKDKHIHLVNYLSDTPDGSRKSDIHMWGAYNIFNKKAMVATSSQKGYICDIESILKGTIDNTDPTETTVVTDPVETTAPITAPATSDIPTVPTIAPPENTTDTLPETDTCTTEETIPTESVSDKPVTYYIGYVPLKEDIEAGCSFRIGLRDTMGYFYSSNAILTDSEYNGSKVYMAKFDVSPGVQVAAIQYQVFDKFGNWKSQILVKGVTEYSEYADKLMVAKSSDSGELCEYSFEKPTLPTEPDTTLPPATTPTETHTIVTENYRAFFTYEGLNYNFGFRQNSMNTQDIYMTNTLEKGEYQFKITDGEKMYGNSNVNIIHTGGNLTNDVAMIPDDEPFKITVSDYCYFELHINTATNTLSIVIINDVEPTIPTTAPTETATTATEETTAETEAVAVPKLNVAKVNLKSGSEKTLKVTDGKVKAWKSSKQAVAKVTSNGKVYALAKGTAKITATLSDGKKLTCTVTVTTSPKLNKASITVKKGKTVAVKITGKSKSVNNIYTNTKYAKVTSAKSATTIKVKGLKRGTTTLKIKVNGKALKLKVKVR